MARLQLDASDGLMQKVSEHASNEQDEGGPLFAWSGALARGARWLKTCAEVSEKLNAEVNAVLRDEASAMSKLAVETCFTTWSGRANPGTAKGAPTTAYLHRRVGKAA